MDFRGAIIDPIDAGIPIIALDRQIAAITGPAKDLHGAVNNMAQHLGCLHLQHGNAASHLLARINPARRVPERKTRSIDLHGRVRQHLLNHLEITDWRTKLPPLTRIIEALIHHQRGFANGSCHHLREADTAKGREGEFQPLPLGAKQMIAGKTNILKLHFNMRGAAQPHHWLITPNGETRHSLFYDEGRDTVNASRRIGNGGHNKKI